MKRAALTLALALVGCGIGNPDSAGVSPPGAPPPPPPPVLDPNCGVEFRFDPPVPIANPTTKIRVSAVGDARSAAVGWSVTLGATTIAVSDVQPDHAVIEFAAITPGVYTISLQLADSQVGCSRDDYFANALNNTAYHPYHEASGGVESRF